MKTTLKITMCAAALCVAGQASADNVGEFVSQALDGGINHPMELEYLLETGEERRDACVALMAFAGQQAAFGGNAPIADLIQGSMGCAERMETGQWGR